MKLFNFTAALLSVFLLVTILVIGQSILLPLVLALVLWYLILTIADALERLSARVWKIPHWLAMLLAFVISLVGIGLLVSVINENITQVIKMAPIYQVKLDFLLDRVYNFFHWVDGPDVSEIFHNIDFKDVASGLAGALATALSYAGIIFVYVLFLFLEYHIFDNKLAIIFAEQQHHQKAKRILGKINTDIKTYFLIKTLVSAATGFLTYLVLAIAGVDFAGFWGILAFILNFIPTFGSIIAAAVPILFTLIQMPSLLTFVLVAVALVAIQFTVGNVIEPRLTGRSLNLSALVILISLAVWGAIWGVIGMFLCVPLMVTLNIILAKFPQTKNIAIMMSADGNIEEN